MTNRSSQLSSTVLVASLGLCLAGCQGAIWGNLVVLAVTVGIFVGTLGLGRSSASASSAEASSSSSGTPRR